MVPNTEPLKQKLRIFRPDGKTNTKTHKHQDPALAGTQRPSGKTPRALSSHPQNRAPQATPRRRTPRPMNLLFSYMADAMGSWLGISHGYLELPHFLLYTRGQKALGCNSQSLTPQNSDPQTYSAPKLTQTTSS